MQLNLTRPARMGLAIVGVAAATTLGLSTAAGAAGVTPSTVARTTDPGASFTVDKVVSTAAVAPNADIVFLVDTTGSMGSVLANVKTNLGTIVSTVKASSPSAQFAVTEFKDFPPNSTDPYGFKVDTPLTGTEATVQTGVNGLSASGGGDTPEAWINGLYQVGTGAISYRADSSRVVVLISDADSHDPSNGHTLAAATTALNAAHVRVLGINEGAMDSTGQATSVTSATGGKLVSASDPSETSAAILKGLAALPVNVKPVVKCEDGLKVSFDKPDSTVTSGSDAHFTETVAVDSGAHKGAVIKCTVQFYINGMPAGDAYTETITVTVGGKVIDRIPPRVKCLLAPHGSGWWSWRTGVFELVAADNLDPHPMIWVLDSASHARFGPFPSGTEIQVRHGFWPAIAPGHSPVDWVITLRGSAELVAVDHSGNTSRPVQCGCFSLTHADFVWHDDRGGKGDGKGDGKGGDGGYSPKPTPTPSTKMSVKPTPTPSSSTRTLR